MDDTKKIRQLHGDPETNMWKADQVFTLRERDTAHIVYSDFDEYTISDGVLHKDDKLYFLLDSKSKDNLTWASEQIMLDNHMHVAGPRYAKESGMIWYMQQHAGTITEEGADGHDPEADFLSGRATGNKNFKGFSVVMQPLGDLSFIDLLPQRGENNNNFVSFISEEYVLMNYSGRFLVFDLKGKFCGQVNFHGQKEGFRKEQIKLKNVSDSGKFFVFQGPRFLTKDEKAKAKIKKKEKK